MKLQNAGLSLNDLNPSRIGVYLGITEHGNVEIETEVCQLVDHYDEDVKYWTHHHNPRTVANNPAGEITVNLDLPDLTTQSVPLVLLEMPALSKGTNASFR